MDWLNYHHLHYFWTVAREGSIAAAARKLHVGRPAISMQVKSLEQALGAELFERRGRRLTLTETGRLVQSYADDIFETGRELVDAVRGRPGGRALRFRVGIADVMAKLMAFRLLLPALQMDEPVQLECREERPRELFAMLAVHELDLVLSDVPLTPGLDVRAYSHVVGRSTTTLFAAPRLARNVAPDFPRSLDGAPMLLPSKASALRRALEGWFDSHDLRPEVVAEFEDSALLKVFGQEGLGVFPAPTVVAKRVTSQFGVRALGEVEGVQEVLYAISPERRIQHPAAARIVEVARESLFGANGDPSE